MGQCSFVLSVFCGYDPYDLRFLRFYEGASSAGIRATAATEYGKSELLRFLVFPSLGFLSCLVHNGTSREVRCETFKGPRFFSYLGNVNDYRYYEGAVGRFFLL